VGDGKGIANHPHCRIRDAQISKIEWLVIALSLLLVTIVWRITNRTPRAKKNSVGFGVAIHFESAAQEKAVEADLLGSLKNLLERGKKTYEFEMIRFSSRQSRDLDTDAVRKLMSEARCHFLIYGTARVRALQGKDTHVFDLRGVVSHGEIPPSESKEFAAEFTAIFPPRLLVAKQDDLFAFEFTAQIWDLVIRYIVGVAAYYTADLDFAEELLLGVDSQLIAANPKDSTLKKIKQGAAARILNVYRSRAYSCGNTYRVSRDKQLLRKAEDALDKLEARCPTDYRGLILRAIISFALYRDVERARQALKKCRKVIDSLWMYNDAFLFAYEGDLQSAYKLYRQAETMPLNDETLPVQLEEFIQIVIDEEPHQTQLYYCLGFINFRIKGDRVAAKRDFAHFLERTEQQDFPVQHEAVRKWIAKLDHTLEESSAAA
jgi:hypothetical protein